MNNIWEFMTAQKIIFGNGSLQRLEKIVYEHQTEKILIVTDAGIKKAGILDRVEQIVTKNNYDFLTFDEVQTEPTLNFINNTYQRIKVEIAPDIIVALGGGSSLDTAKIISLLLTHGGHPRDYCEGKKKVPGPVIPIITIPTTAGTGSEVTSVAVITDEENNVKVGISDNYLRATAAILDPELTVGLPSYITACSGIDALAHAVEAYMAKPYKYMEDNESVVFQGSFPLADVLALQAIELISKNIKKAVHQGNNLEARSNMLLGSLLAGIAFSNAGTAIAHALAYPIGAISKSPHGEITGLLLPYVMKFNSTVEYEKIKNLAKVFDLQVKQKTEKDTVLSVYSYMLGLIEDIGLPTKLSNIGIQKDDISFIADKTLKIDRLVRNNPRNVNKSSIVKLLYDAI